MKTLTSLLLLPLFLLVTGCSTLGGGKDTTHFYSLSSFDSASALTNNPLKLGIGPVRLPHRLKRPQIVTRINQNELYVNEQYQWAGSLKEDITQVLTDNLSALLGTEQIEKYPWKRHYKPDYRVRIQIEQLDGEPGKSVTLKARWWLRNNLSNKLSPAKKSTFSVPVQGKDFTQYVAAQSRAIYQLSQAIASDISGENH